MPPRPPGTPDVDLTYDDASGTINGAVFMTGLFQFVPDQFSTFLEIRNNGVEQGYNTDGALQQNQRDTQNSTHSILLAEVPIVIGDGSHGTVEGVAYREFRLNIGEAGNAKQYLSLDALQIWQEEAGNLTNFTPGAGFAGAHTNYLAYDLDAGGDRWIGLQEGLNGNGAIQTEFTILIPDSAFINDPAHRYVTLYSKFGQQAGWEADSSSEQWGLSHASGGPVSAMTVHKTATVPGGTADAVGEVISYGITVANVGNTNLTGIMVTDPSVSNLVLASGDNGNGVLDVGETWQYTANYTVTQDDINTDGGGDGFITNVVTADSAQTAPVSASASIEVESGISVSLVKMANVTSVDAAGDLITYTIAVTNDGNVTLSGVEVNDTQVNIATPIFDFNTPILGAELLSQVLDGDYNAGDTNENGVQDPGETFQYVNAGDTNQDGDQDLDETFLFTNIGDTNQNGTEDTGETFQYYNAGDTNQDGDEGPGETFQFSFSHAATPVVSGGFNAGDTNMDGQLNVGETWQYAVIYTVTQDDIDNGGVVQPGLTHDNTATVTTSQSATDEDTESVLIVQNPHLTLVKSASVPGGTADTAGEIIAYTINVTNDGNMTLTSVMVSDPSVSNLAAVESGGFNAGDADQDGKLDLGETWQYTANHAVTQDDIDNGGVVQPGLTYTNTATVTTAQGASDTDTASVPIAQNPHVTLVKNAAVVGGVVDEAGDVIRYRINVTNDGNMTLTSVVVSDPSVSNLAAVETGSFNDGDADQDGKLDVGETWKYTADHTVTQADIDNGGVVDPLLTYDNTATVTTAQGATDDDTASVAIAQNPHVVLEKTATVPGGTADVAELIEYMITVQNDGNMTLTNPVVTDTFASNLHGLDLNEDTFNDGDINNDGHINVGETWTYVANHVVTQEEFDAGGTIDNTASVATDEGASSSDSASVTVNFTPMPSFTLAMTALGYHDANYNGFADVGDTIDFSLIEMNTGNVALHNIVVSGLDGVVTFNGSVASLAVGATDSTSITGTRVISSGDFSVGYVEDEAVGQADEAPPSPVSGTVHVVLADLILLL